MTFAVPIAERDFSGGSSLNWGKAILLALAAAGCFHLAYSTPWGFLIFGYVICLVQLARLPTARGAFWAGLLVGMLCYAPQLDVFWRVFGPVAIVFWTILAFWLGLYLALAHLAWARLGPARAAILLPFLWTGLEYFRSELYFLRFSWLNVGYALSGSARHLPFYYVGVYGMGFVAAALAACILARRFKTLAAVAVGFAALTAASASSAKLAAALILSVGSPSQVQVAGAQMEFPSTEQVVAGLDRLAHRFPAAELLVLSEYTFDGPAPPEVRGWCAEHRKYLIVGGKDPAERGGYYNTAFVVGPEGEIVFRQVKSVPIQFFDDGLPAAEQQVWNSPWGKIGICICYDLSYTRVTDPLVRLGAQALVVPTMDVKSWGSHQHQLHRRVALVRAAEYRLPLFRVASSGISQAVDRFGAEEATTSFPGDGEMFSAIWKLGPPGNLPLDRLLAPLSVAVTGGFIGWLVLVRLRGQRRSRTPALSWRK